MLLVEAALLVQIFMMPFSMHKFWLYQPTYKETSQFDIKSQAGISELYAMQDCTR
jgi:hypothetical protein